MKILLICASPRKKKSRTFALAKEVLRAALDKGAKAETIHLCDCKISFCRHCELCHKRIMRCPIKDGAIKIMEKMLEADGIILATPNYLNHVTASMKALFDRAAHFTHCRRLLDKYIAGVVSSGSGHDQGVLDYIRYYAHACAAQYSGGVSSAAYAVGQKLQEAYALGEKLVSDSKEKKVYPGQRELIEKGRQHFARIIRMRKEEWVQEYRYWLERGWLKE